MTLANGPAPTTAERIRSTCVRAGGALLAVDGAEPLSTPLHHLLGDGSFAVTVPVGGAAVTHLVDCGAGGAQAVLELADYALLPLREPVRSLVWIRGRLHEVPLPTVHGVLDRIADEHPNPALLQVQTSWSGPVADDDTRYLLARLDIESVVAAYKKTERPGPRPSTWGPCWPRARTRSARSNRAGFGTWTPPIETWSPDWPPGCPRGCGAATSAPSA